MYTISGAIDRNAEENEERRQQAIPLAVFHEPMAITIQPRMNDDSSFYGSTSVRRPIPVDTSNPSWITRNDSQFIPLNGLDFLTNTEQLCIQQTVELDDLLSNIESENRYYVKVPNGETLYYGCESSSSWHRMCFGASRKFLMRLFDHTQQEALHFHRRLAGNNCLFGCYLQQMEVYLPPGNYLGRIKQELTLTIPSFTVHNKDDTQIFRVEGPSICICDLHKKSHFKILSVDGMTQLGSIVHQWDELAVAYNLRLSFPGRSTNNSYKALLLGAAFLLEYMYFESANKPGCCKRR